MFFDILAKIIGYIAIVEGFFIFISKDRKKILILKFLSDLLWMLNHFFIKAFTGAFLFVVAMFREVIFYLRDKYKWADSKLWLIFFIVVSLISPLLTWQGPVSLLPAFGSAIFVFCLFIKETLTSKKVGFIGQVLWLIYAICIMNVQNIISSSICLISLIIGLINEKRLKIKV